VSRTLENSTAASIATPVTNEELRYELSSVIKKRKKKMRKHKLKKLRRKLKNAK
jgi:hypothetical protein